MTKRWTRIIALLGAAVMAGTLFAGCGKTESAASTAAASSEATAATAAAFTPRLDTEKAVELNVSGFFGNFEALDQVVNNFNEYYPNVTISYESNSSSQLVEYLRNNTSVDIVMTDDTNFRYPDWTDDYIMDQVADLSAEDIDLSNVQDDLMAECTIDGKVVRLPIGQKLSGMVVNKTLLRKEGLSIPTNYQEFLDVCAALKEKGYTPIQGASTAVYSGLVYNMAMVELGTDADLLTALNNGDEAAVTKMEEVYSRLEELLEKGYTDPAVNAEYPDDNYDGAILKFFEGDVPFWVAGTEKVCGMKKRESKSEAYMASPFEYEFMYAPMGDKGCYEFVEPWVGFSVNKNSNDYDYAVEFLRFLATEDQLNTIASIKGVPSVAKNSTDERYTDIGNPERVQARFVNDGTLLNHMKDYFNIIANRVGKGDITSAKEAAQNYVGRCAETAQEMAQAK